MVIQNFHWDLGIGWWGRAGSQADITGCRKIMPKAEHEYGISLTAEQG